MTRSKSQKSAQEQREIIVKAALMLAKDKGWRDLSLQEIGRKAGLPAGALDSLFENKDDILTTYGRMVDRRVADAFADGLTDGNPRDRLFDVLMERFDILNEDRASLIAILDDIRCDPSYTTIALPHLVHTMKAMLDIAGLENSGLQGTATIFGLAILYMTVIKTWVEDESTDMAKTMAALDHHLARAEKLAAMAGFSD